MAALFLRPDEPRLGGGKCRLSATGKKEKETCKKPERAREVISCSYRKAVRTEEDTPPPSERPSAWHHYDHVLRLLLTVATDCKI